MSFWGGLDPGFPVVILTLPIAYLNFESGARDLGKHACQWDS